MYISRFNLHSPANASKEHLVDIEKIYTIKFEPKGEQYEAIHCAFVLKLRSGSYFVFDPTGCQFGPDWPLICPASRYGHLHIDEVLEAYDV